MVRKILAVKALVRPDDPALQKPTKPIGVFYSKKEIKYEIFNL